MNARSNFGVITTVTILTITFLIGMSRAKSPPIMPFNAHPNVTVDGVVTKDEYSSSYFEVNTKITVNWMHDGINMYVAITSQGTGWVGIGFGPRGTGMDGANIINGYVDSSGAVVEDYFGRGWTHSRDSSNDMIDSAGSESSSQTTIEFVFPLDSGDPFDQSFQPGGTYGFFVGYHASVDDLRSYHTKRSATIDLNIELMMMEGNMPPKADFSYISHDATVDFLDKSTDADGFIVSWNWDFGDGSTSTERNPTHIFPGISMYKVSLTVTDDRGARSVASRRIMVPPEEVRLQLWTTQVIVVAVSIAFLSFIAVGTTRKMGAKEKG